MDVAVEDAGTDQEDSTRNCVDECFGVVDDEAASLDAGAEPPPSHERLRRGYTDLDPCNAAFLHGLSRRSRCNLAPWLGAG